MCVLALLALCACEEPAPEAPRVQFIVPNALPDLDELVRLDADSTAEVRLQVLEAMEQGDIPPTFVGAGPWESVAVVTRGGSVDDAIRRGRVYVRRGGALNMDVRLGAGDRGTHMGGVVGMGAERAMIEVKVEDRETLGARFEIRLHAGDGRGRGRAEDVTPTYLARALPRGTYRAWVDVPPNGGRFVVEVRTLSRGGDTVGRAWASPIAVERPWLQ